MIFDHVVKYGSKYYAAGEDVPMENEANGVTEEVAPSSFIETSSEDAKKYTFDELAVMTVKEIKAIASEKGITLKKVSPKDAVIEEFLSKQ